MYKCVHMYMNHLALIKDKRQLLLSRNEHEHRLHPRNPRFLNTGLLLETPELFEEMADSRAGGGNTKMSLR